MSQQLLLIGGGHAHLGVLEAFARKPLRDTDITLVSRFDNSFYSGMLPGWIAGHYRIDQCVIPLPPLAERAGATFFRDRVLAIDLVERVAYTQSGAPLPFDVLSINTGPEIDRDAIRGLGDHALPLRPIEKFVEAWQRIDARFSGAPHAGTLTIVGGGAAGVEIAMAIAHRVGTSALRLKVQLITGRPGLLPALTAGVRKRVAPLLPKIGVRVIEDEVVAVGADRVQLGRAGELLSDVTVVAIGAAAARWPRDCGLKCDARGFIAVNSALQSLSHPFVFAAGDCASMPDHPRAKSGVYALHAGATLATNLRRALAGRSLRRHIPQPLALYLLSAGAKNAVGIWGPLIFEGERVWRWKDRIDRAHIARFNPDAPR
jgi:pyridine nucleotide-disulfide oxidoreductase family protein